MYALCVNEEMLKVDQFLCWIFMIFYKLFLRTSWGKKGALRSISLFLTLKLVIKVFFEEQPELEEWEDSFLGTFLEVEDSIELLAPLGLSLLSILVEVKSSSDSSLTFSSSVK